MEKEWNLLALFRRDSNRAAAYHEEVKKFIFERLAKEKGFILKNKLNELVGVDGVLLKYNGYAWNVIMDENDFAKALKKNAFAYEATSLEHRRWCYFMLSRGWRYGERSDRRRKNPCITTYERLMKDNPEMLKYDLMSLMAMYKKNK